MERRKFIKNLAILPFISFNINIQELFPLVYGEDLPTKEFYSIANKMVGKVGEPTDMQCSVTGGNYIEIAFLAHTKKELFEKWIKAIAGYYEFAKYKFTGCISDHEKPLKIYWRITPEVKYINNNYYLYARLLISSAPKVDIVIRDGVEYDMKRYFQGRG